MDSQQGNFVATGRRILIADDDHILRAVATMALQAKGFDIIEASDGAEALTRLRENKVDLLLLDLDMPNVCGFDVIEAVRADERLRQLPIVIATSREDVIAIERAFGLGATSFATKPINWNILVHQIRHVLRSSRLEAEHRLCKTA